MFKTQETKVLGSIRKIKKYGACGVILGMAALAIAFSGGKVSADELVARQSVSNTVQETTSAPVKVEVVSETGYPSTNLTEKQPEPTAEHVEMTNNANKAGKEIVTSVETPELDNAVKKAKGAGVEVTEKPQVIYDTLAEAKDDEKKQVKAIEEAKAEKIENTEAIQNANDTNAQIEKDNEDEKARVKKLNEEDEARVKQANEKEVARVKKLNEEIANENKAKMEALGLTYTGDLEKDKKAIADYIVRAKLSNESGLKELEEKRRQAQALHDKNRAIMEAKGLTYTGVWRTDKAAVDQWNKENAGVRVITTKETGLTATADTTFEAVAGASKVTPPAYVQNVIQGYARNTNLDAKFDNVFLFDYKTGTATIKVKNTSHGDVTVNFDSVTPSAESGFIRSYVALWAAEDGGIGYGVFISAGAGEANGGGGVDGQGGGYGASGAYLNDRQGWVKQVNVQVITDADDVSEVTVNDVDSNQVIKASTIDGAKITTGKNITQSGNTFTANNSAQSQSTAGVLDSNGIGWSLDKGQKINFSFDHINTSDTSYSIVGGLFGRASQKEVKENVEPISIKEVEDPNFTPKKTDPVELKKPVEPKLIDPDPEDPVLKPYVPVPDEKKISVEYHKTAVKYAPKISKGVVNDDNVNIDGKLVPKGSIVNWTLNTGMLKAGREVMSAIELNDPLESGYLLDTKATAKVNPTLEFTHNGQGRTLIKFGARELAKVNANLDKDYVMPQIKLIGTVLNDNGFYNNTYSMTLTTKSKKKYTVTSNTPKVKTSGSKPVKDVVDNKGVSINGKSVLPTTELNYKFTQNFSNYKGIEASKSAIMKNFLMIDDPDENALDTSTMHVKSITAGNKDVSELLQMYRVLSMESLGEKLRKIITDSGISPVGEFYMWAAKDPESFYEAYLKKGLDITYNFSFKIKKTFTEGDIVNAVHQIDFGNGYAGNKVVNHLPKPEVHKDVLNAKGESIDGKEIQLGDTITYKLEGWVIPAGRGYDLFEYRFVDTLDVEHDEYQGFTIKAIKDLVLPNGKVIKAGDDLKGYTETIYNAKTGLFETRFTKDFLASIPRTSEFGADAFLEVKRIKHGEVFNEYTLFVNGTPVLSNEVKTYSKPKPTPPTPPTQNELPNTGEGSSMLGVAGLILSLATSGYVVTVKRKEN
ncbi:SspB-related isopeptide-forming adhesin [Streptococcus sp. oral taxon 431]|uniref:SspB-related isopeptide-forming adhesin n=1 Tax=Streptococcus sp. oral taxon 431 TaxID=712633 RepID=UPI00200640E6|nr:SspB-related isopeptide-forming adhesin [Streptococcus sp. oral taxon 431]